MDKRVITTQISKKARRKFSRVKQQSPNRPQRVALFLAIITTVCAVVFTVRVISYRVDLKRSKHAMSELRESSYDADMRQINSDYVGIIKIEGTNIGYPVARGDDNEKYLNTTFHGEDNLFGAVFMDYRCTGEYVPHILIYGHNCYDDDGEWYMFGGLLEFRDEKYLAEHPTILYMENDRVSEYEILTARATDINDPAYYLDFNKPNSFAAFLKRNGMPTDAEQVITLSTCIGADNDKRMIVQGVLRGVYPVELEYDDNGLEMNIQRHS